MKTGVETIWKDRKRFLGMPLSFTRYSLSEDRLFLQKGLFNMQFEEIVLYRVSDISLKRTLGQRIFGTGTVIVHSSDKTTPHFELKNIRGPLSVKELIHRQVEEMKIARRVRVGELINDGETGDDPCDSPAGFGEDDSFPEAD